MRLFGIATILTAMTWNTSPENELLMSEEVQKERFFDAYKMGLFTDANGQIPERVKQRALEFMKVGNYTEIMNINALQIQAGTTRKCIF